MPSLRMSVVSFGIIYLTAVTIILIFFIGKCGHRDRNEYGKGENKFETSNNETEKEPDIPLLTFKQVLQNFPWDNYSDSLYRTNLRETQHFSGKLYLKALEFLQKAPATPANPSCRPPHLSLPKSLICNRPSKAKRVGLLLQFDYNVDALEVHLHELHDLVDKFFIIESSRQINTYLETKPLLWDRLKYDERFLKFLPKIVYFSVDDSEFMLVGGAGQRNRRFIYSHELLLERFGWMKFLHWNSATNYFGPEDLIGFGEASEIPYRDNIFTLKSCQFYSYSVDIGIWSPSRRMETVSQTDFPVKSNPYTLASPTFWTVQSAMRSFNATKNIPTKMKGKSPAFLLGGMHMSNFDYLPHMIARLLSNFNLKENVLRRVVDAGKLYNSGLINELELKEKVRKLLPLAQKSKVLNLSDFSSTFPEDYKQIIRIPWFIACNPTRYEYLVQGNSDDDLGSIKTFF